MVTQVTRPFTLGIMQGRLSPPVDGRIQAFPQDSWEAEFELASLLGIRLIEWIVDAQDIEANPLLIGTGIDRLRELEDRTGVLVRTVCADCFMKWPLTTADVSLRQERVALLGRILPRCRDLGVLAVTLPFVDESEIRTSQEFECAALAIKGALEIASDCGVMLALETSLASRDFLNLLTYVDHPNLGVTYDMGNSASLGYDPAEELSCYGTFIVTTHIKDRMLGGGTVPLGTGNVDFPTVFKLLSELGFTGPFILQGARGRDEVPTIQQYIEFLRPFLTSQKSRQSQT